MFLCYLAVQRYNFFVENKIFPNFFSKITHSGPATERNMTENPDRTTLYGAQNRYLLYKMHIKGLQNSILNFILPIFADSLRNI